MQNIVTRRGIEDLRGVLSAYDYGYFSIDSNIDQGNPYRAGTPNCGDWNEGFLDRRNGIPYRGRWHYHNTPPVGTIK